jgi:hypothetical protein
MGKVVAILWIGAILFGGFWFGYYQEGANRDITVEVDGAVAPQGVPVQIELRKLYASGNNAAMELAIKAGGRRVEGRVIYDMANNEEIVVCDAIKAYAKTSFDLVDKSECKRATSTPMADDEDAKRLPDSRTIAGYRCHAFAGLEEGREIGKAWYTYEIRLGRTHIALVNKLLRIDADSGFFIGHRTSKEKPEQVSGFDYFPVPLAARGRAGDGRMSLDVKSVSRDKIDKDVFEVPGSYDKMELEELFKQMFIGQR